MKCVCVCKMVVMSFDMLALADSCLCIRVYSTIMIRKRTTENFVCKSNFYEMQKQLRSRAFLHFSCIVFHHYRPGEKKKCKNDKYDFIFAFFFVCNSANSSGRAVFFLALALTRNSFN